MGSLNIYCIVLSVHFCSVFISRFSTLYLCLISLTDVRDELEQFSHDIRQTADLIRDKLKGNLIKILFFFYLVQNSCNQACTGHQEHLAKQGI